MKTGRSQSGGIDVIAYPDQYIVDLEAYVRHNRVVPGIGCAEKQVVVIVREMVFAINPGGKLLCFGLPHKQGMRGDVHAFRHFELGSRMEQMPHGKLVFTAEKRFLGSEQMEYGIPDKGVGDFQRVSVKHEHTGVEIGVQRVVVGEVLSAGHRWIVTHSRPVLLGKVQAVLVEGFVDQPALQSEYKISVAVLPEIHIVRSRCEY